MAASAVLVGIEGRAHIDVLPHLRVGTVAVVATLPIAVLVLLEVVDLLVLRVGGAHCLLSISDSVLEEDVRRIGII